MLLRAIALFLLRHKNARRYCDAPAVVMMCGLRVMLFVTWCATHKTHRGTVCASIFVTCYGMVWHAACELEDRVDAFFGRDKDRPLDDGGDGLNLRPALEVEGRFGGRASKGR